MKRSVLLLTCFSLARCGDADVARRLSGPRDLGETQRDASRMDNGETASPLDLGGPNEPDLGASGDADAGVFADAGPGENECGDERVATFEGGVFVSSCPDLSCLRLRSSERSIAPFMLQRLEVSNADYEECRMSGACPEARCATTGDDELPVTCVTRDEAEDYCRWLGGRLPTGDELERALRGTDGRNYPWGDELRVSWAWLSGESNHLSPRSVEEGGKDVTPECVANLVGNVREWTSDLRHSFMQTAFGGSFLTVQTGPRSGYGRFITNDWPADFHSIDIGVRCAFDVEEED